MKNMIENIVVVASVIAATLGIGAVALLFLLGSGAPAWLALASAALIMTFVGLSSYVVIAIEYKDGK